jgi:hypothetical protein
MGDYGWTDHVVVGRNKHSLFANTFECSSREEILSFGSVVRTASDDRDSHHSGELSAAESPTVSLPVTYPVSVSM